MAEFDTEVTIVSEEDAAEVVTPFEVGVTITVSFDADEGIGSVGDSFVEIEELGLN